MQKVYSFKLSNKRCTTILPKLFMLRKHDFRVALILKLHNLKNVLKWTFLGSSNMLLFA